MSAPIDPAPHPEGRDTESYETTQPGIPFTVEGFREAPEGTSPVTLDWVTRGKFRDAMGHPLENNVEFQALVAAAQATSPKAQTDERISEEDRQEFGPNGRPAPSMWMADSRPLLAEISSLKEQADALAKERDAYKDDALTLVKQIPPLRFERDNLNHQVESLSAQVSTLQAQVEAARVALESAKLDLESEYELEDGDDPNGFFIARSCRESLGLIDAALALLDGKAEGNPHE